MDYFTHGNRRRGNSVTQERLNAPLPVPGRHLVRQPSRESLRPSSIRIRRLPSSNSTRPVSAVSDFADAESPERQEVDDAVATRRRSLSAPQRTNLEVPGVELARQSTVEPYMQTIVEGAPAPAPSSAQPTGGLRSVDRYDGPTAPPTPANLEVPEDVANVADGAQAMHSAGNAARSNRGLRRFRSGVLPSRRDENPDSREYSADYVDFLDLVDPEVQTLGTLTNVQNSLFVPDLGRFLNRRPTYDLTRRPTAAGDANNTDGIKRTPSGTSYRPPRSRAGKVASPAAGDALEQATSGGSGGHRRSSGRSGRDRRISISSQLTESHYAVLPHGVKLDNWTDEDIADLNDHVRHMLHSRREGFKRTWAGFKKYISKPLGLFVFIYATLVTLFGTAWVLFLIGWIYVDSRQQYTINVIDNILVALFALMGDGLAPFRVIDTYHMCFIAHYHHLTWDLRKKKDMPKLPDHNDLPRISMDVPRQPDIDLEETAGKSRDSIEENQEYSVLSVRQQARLEYHASKFSKSHTFYKPHETSTHHAFPLRLLVAVVVLLDFHSIFQIALGTCTWSIGYKHRPEALTATILACSLTCNITAGILVSIGDRRTRKKEVLDRLFRQDLTKQAIKDIQKRYSENDKTVVPVFDDDDDDDHHNGPKLQTTLQLDREALQHEHHRATRSEDDSEAVEAAAGVEI